MTQPDFFIYASAVTLLAEIALSINNARLAKAGAKVPGVFGLPPAMLFFVFHTTWWLSSYKTGGTIFLYVLSCIASFAFLFGSSFVTSGCLTICNDELCVDTDNKVFQLMQKLPIKFEGKSLCSISWKAAFCLFLLPIVYTILGTLFAVVSLIICAFTWQNPIAYWSSIVVGENWPTTEMQKDKHGRWKSPIVWVFLGAIIGTLFLLIGWHMDVVWVGFKWILIFVLPIALIYVGIEALGYVLWNRYEALTPDVKAHMDSDVKLAYAWINEDEKFKRPVYIWGVFWQVFRQKYCPKIKYCTTNKTDDTNCRDAMNG